MSMCRKCWNDAGRIATFELRSKAEVYGELIEKRECTPEQQAGKDAKYCPKCSRWTIHEITGECMNGSCLTRKEFKISELLTKTRDWIATAYDHCPELVEQIEKEIGISFPYINEEATNDCMAELLKEAIGLMKRQMADKTAVDYMGVSVADDFEDFISRADAELRRK